ncbi:TPA: hypothetical protein ACN7KQ_003137 [Klebsiella pneumoniae]
MKIYVGLISLDPSLIKEFNAVKEALIPKPIREKLPKKCNFKFDAFNPTVSKGALTIDSHILKETDGFDYATCLIDERLDTYCQNIRHAILCASVIPDEVKDGNLRNFFSNRLTKLFKSAIFTIEKMSTSEIEQAMCLPIRNFKAQDLSELCRLYREDVIEAHFHNTARQQITAISRRRQPRRKSNYSTKYFIDDDSKHFIFGKEEHSKLGTGDPHLAHCVVNGNFRFGKKIVTDHHYNVSKGDGDKTSISGNFPNCHDEIITVNKGKTHLNMFSNDHF